MPAYVYGSQCVISQQIQDSIGLTPTSCASNVEAAVTFASPLSVEEKQSLDDFMQDRGFVFKREEP